MRIARTPIMSTDRCALVFACEAEIEDLDIIGIEVRKWLNQPFEVDALLVQRGLPRSDEIDELVSRRGAPAAPAVCK